MRGKMDLEGLLDMNLLALSLLVLVLIVAAAFGVYALTGAHRR
jgi:hypothetical protein